MSILKQYKSTCTEGAGEVESRLKEESDIYHQRQKEVKEKSKLVPLGEGSLIFDEFKVTAKLQWNSRDNSLVGYAMTSDEVASITDLYQYLDKDASIPRPTMSCRLCGEITPQIVILLGHTIPVMVA